MVRGFVRNTPSFRQPHGYKSRGFKSGDTGGHASMRQDNKKWPCIWQPQQRGLLADFWFIQNYSFSNVPRMPWYRERRLWNRLLCLTCLFHDATNSSDTLNVSRTMVWIHCNGNVRSPNFSTFQQTVFLKRWEWTTLRQALAYATWIRKEATAARSSMHFAGTTE